MYFDQDFIIRVLADYLILPIIFIGLYALIFKVKKGYRIEAYSRMLLAGLTAYLLAKLIGSIYQPITERPFELLGTIAGASFLNNPGFPSDHVLFAASIVSAVWFETKQKIITILLLILLFGICFGRIMALVHAPIDIAGALLITLFSSLWYINCKNVV